MNPIYCLVVLHHNEVNPIDYVKQKKNSIYMSNGQRLWFKEPRVHGVRHPINPPGPMQIRSGLFPQNPKKVDRPNFRTF